MYLSSGIGAGFCGATSNSTGSVAQVAATGSTSVASNDIVLSAAPVPNEPGLFFYGPNQIEQPFGNGALCVGGMLARLPVITA